MESKFYNTNIISKNNHLNSERKITNLCCFPIGSRTGSCNSSNQIKFVFTKTHYGSKENELHTVASKGAVTV